MTALTWALNVVAVAGAAWAVTWGSIGWSAGRRAGVDPAKAAVLCWLIGPIGLPILKRWQRARTGSVAFAERAGKGAQLGAAAIRKPAERRNNDR